MPNCGISLKPFGTTLVFKSIVGVCDWVNNSPLSSLYMCDCTKKKKNRVYWEYDELVMPSYTQGSNRVPKSIKPVISEYNF